MLAGMAHLRRDVGKGARRAGEDRAEIDDRDLRRGGMVILDAKLLEQVHRRCPSPCGADYRPPPARWASKPGVCFLCYLQGIYSDPTTGVGRAEPANGSTIRQNFGNFIVAVAVMGFALLSPSDKTAPSRRM